MLGRLIEKAIHCNAIHGFIVGRDKVEVSHLQFADDTLLFLKANRNYFLNYLTLLEVFGSISGLRVNLRKSIDDDLLQNMAAFSGYEVGVWPIKYLGLPSRGNP